jgi:YebC/PmpR family DNA-binding regulatory protein
MAGHSHWAGIKHKKAANDAKRGRIWSKLARNIIVSAKAGGGDPDQNLALRYAIDKAKEGNMPKDTIDKAIKKGTGDLDGVSYEEVLYEGYGNDGVAVMCEVLTDNRNRTASELRKIFEKKGGSLGTTGCVAWMFTKKGLFTVDAADCDEDTVMEIALEAGADDVVRNEDSFEVTCAVEDFQSIKQALAEKEINTQVSEISQIPSSLITLDETGSKKVLDLMEMLEDQDDVQNVSANFDIPDDIMKKLESA